jgi:hypothetical protein
MGKFHHSSKHHGDKKKFSSSRLKYDMTQAGRRKLPEDFLYTQKNHMSIWNSFSNFLDEKFAEGILDDDEVTRIKTAPAIPPMLQFEPQTPGEVESEESKRVRARGQSLADKSYAGREAQYFEIHSKEARSEIQSSNCVSAQAHRCTHQPGYASVSQVGHSQAPRPRDQVQKDCDGVLTRP